MFVWGKSNSKDLPKKKKMGLRTKGKVSYDFDYKQYLQGVTKGYER